MVWLVVLGVPLLLLLGGSVGLSLLEERQAVRRRNLDQMVAQAQAMTARLLAQLQAMQAWPAQDGWPPSQKEKGMR
jgi:uncharacterized membrane protein YhfC